MKEWNKAWRSLWGVVLLALLLALSLYAEDYILTQDVKVMAGQTEVTLPAGQEVAVLGASDDKTIIRAHLANGNDGVFQVAKEMVSPKEKTSESTASVTTAPVPPPVAPVAKSEPAPQETTSPQSTTTGIASGEAKEEIPHGGFKKAFGGRLPRTRDKTVFDPSAYNMDKELYYIYVPPNYTSAEPFGLLVFINAGDTMGLPAGWDKVLEQKKLLYIAPQNVGNNQQHNRRVDLSYIGLAKMMELYKVDEKRVYTTGMSGGARTANWFALMHPDVISGTLPICGADFIKAVPKIRATKDDAYGSIGGFEGQSVAKIKSKIRFVFITGDKDWRLGNIQDIFEEGYKREHFQAKLIQVPDMGHEICKGEPLLEGLEFIESREP